jgi:AcrR family transcriptional regulator
MGKSAKRSTSRRKSPKQSRSKALVEAILEATTRILPEQGLDRTSTNRIAELAGVSIGSLYQYFPNKDAILAYLMERDLSAQARTYRAMIDDMRGEPLERVVETVVKDASERYLAQPELVRTVFVHAARLQQLETILASRKSVGEAVGELIRQRPELSMQAEEADRTAFVIINAVMGVYQTWVLSEPSDRMSTDALDEHLQQLILGYLLGARRGSNDRA